MGDFEKKFPPSACRKKKNCMQHKCNRKLMGKKGKKNILPTRLLEKKSLMTRNHPPSASRVIIKATSPLLLRSRDVDQLSRLRRRENDQ